MDTMIHFIITGIYLVTIGINILYYRFECRKLRDEVAFWKDQARIGGHEAMKWKTKCQLFEATKLENPNNERNAGL